MTKLYHCPTNLAESHFPAPTPHRPPNEIATVKLEIPSHTLWVVFNVCVLICSSRLSPISDLLYASHPTGIFGI
ncbi:hypothetical protein QQG55_41355 [Brugia pahangi]